MSYKLGPLLRFGGANSLRLLSNYPPRSAADLRGFSTSCQSRNLHIDVSPKESLLDKPPVIRVEGCKSKQKVTLWNSYVDDIGLIFASHAHYIANEEGVIDVKNDVSYGGKFKGVFMEGLMLTMNTVPPVYENKPKLKWARLLKRDVTQPMKYTLKVMNGHLAEEDLYGSRKPDVLGEEVFLRHLMGDGVRRIEVEEGGVLGVIFLPPGDGPFPLVLDLFGAESGIKEFRSAMLASYGFASFVLPYYSYKYLPVLEDRVNLDYFLKGIDYLTNLPQGAGDRIGLVGSSKGGEIGIALSGLTDKIKACVSINAYHRSIDVDYYLNDKLFLEGTVPDKTNSNVSINKEGKFQAYGKGHFYHWDISKILPIEKIHRDCKVLIAAGDEDGGHGHRSAMILKERAWRFRKENVSTIIYPGVGHLIDPPFHAHIDAVWNSVILMRKEDGTKYKGLPHLYGGNPYDTCQASKDLWRRTLGLFHQTLVQEGKLPTQTAIAYPHY